jgi:hypothetical protein
LICANAVAQSVTADGKDADRGDHLSIDNNVTENVAALDRLVFEESIERFFELLVPPRRIEGDSFGECNEGKITFALTSKDASGPRCREVIAASQPVRFLLPALSTRVAPPPWYRSSWLVIVVVIIIMHDHLDHIVRK